MDMREAIMTQASQLLFEPEIKHADKLKPHSKFIVSGMGGSHLAADIMKCADPLADIIVHSDYGLPALRADNVTNRLFIASSYSGNTEEVLDGLNEAINRNMPTCAIAVGGKLLERAKKENIPYIELPDTGIQPRSALGFSMKALLKIMGKQEASDELHALGQKLIPSACEEEGKQIAMRIRDYVPLVYASVRNGAIAYNWKIKFNETGKIPAFMNVFPELNHNEMTGFDAIESTAALSKNFYALLLRDDEDHPRVQKRMDILKQLYDKRGIPTESITLAGNSRFEKISSSLYCADWAAYHMAMHYGADPSDVPMVEEFKQLMSG